MSVDIVSLVSHCPSRCNLFIILGAHGPDAEEESLLCCCPAVVVVACPMLLSFVRGVMFVLGVCCNVPWRREHLTCPRSLVLSLCISSCVFAVPSISLSVPS